jgi:uncharacterized OsmC-like protein
VYVHDGADVRGSQALATGRNPSDVAALANSRKDYADCETSNGWIDHIDRDVELSGDLDDTQWQLLLLIAERCPAHQTVTSEVRIATSLS